MDNNQIEKEVLRKYIKKIKTDISTSNKIEQSTKAFKRLELSEEFQHAKIVFIYWSLPDELSTHEFIERWCNKKTFLLLAIEGDSINLLKFTSDKKLKKGLLGIMEPDTESIYTGSIDLAIIPGIAFDYDKNRLGRGKGFYDKFLINKAIYKIGICYDFQLQKSIPVSRNDIKMDKIITPQKTI